MITGGFGVRIGLRPFTIEPYAFGNKAAVNYATDTAPSALPTHKVAVAPGQAAAELNEGWGGGRGLLHNGGIAR